MFTSLGLAWQGFLRMSRLEKELLTDIHMLFRKDHKGGCEYYYETVVKANNPDVSDFNINCKQAISSTGT